ncbi:adenylyl-sulfate kinase [Paraglaciecola sp. L3A3]|uniref:adenylyl-sulfate kinase n=1 Tax=Paraglaciecola sp. L3A3 TaxID=2686358 RepID=UPI00131E5D28|nr:adenylyl-sulfate kinase [Paraglaciecola sp. L3A3]
MVIWLTGLPGAGKTTIGQILLYKLRALNKQSLLLDGDKLRAALEQNNYDLESRKSIAFTYGRLGQMFSNQGSVAICATVSMFDDVRAWNAQNISSYLEVYVKVSPEVLHQRNQKNLYSDAETDNAVNIVGFDIAVQEPKSPDLVLVNDGEVSPESLADQILNLIKE